MVKCLNCGFLAVRDELDAGKVYEATESTRAGGLHVGADGEWRAAQIFCLEGCPCFPKRYEPGEKHFCEATEVISIIRQDLDCPKWRKWERGLTPKEHKLMGMWEDIMTRQRKADDRSFRVNMALALGTVAACFAGWIAALWPIWHREAPPAPPQVIVQPATPMVIVQPAAAPAAPKNSARP
jgi:hypothetical protein